MNHNRLRTYDNHMYINKHSFGYLVMKIVNGYLLKTLIYIYICQVSSEIDQTYID